MASPSNDDGFGTAITMPVLISNWESGNCRQSLRLKQYTSNPEKRDDDSNDDNERTRTALQRNHKARTRSIAKYARAASIVLSTRPGHGKWLFAE